MEVSKKLREEARDRWFKKAWPMALRKQTWRKKWLAMEGNGTDSDDGSA
jgi:hypothetical protein